jgi:hypothetical protein
MKKAELSDKDLMFNILNTLFSGETEALIAKAHKHRALLNRSKEDQLIEMTHKMKNELNEIVELKFSFCFYNCSKERKIFPILKIGAMKRGKIKERVMSSRLLKDSIKEALQGSTSPFLQTTLISVL